MTQGRDVLSDAVFALALLFCVLSATLVSAEDETPCKPLAAVLQALPLEVKIIPLHGDELQRAVAIYNATPPASADDYDRAAWVEGKGQAAIYFVSHGEVCGTLTVLPRAIEEVRNRIFGEPS